MSDGLHGGEVIDAVSLRMKARGRSDAEISQMVESLVTNAISSREALLASNYKVWIPLGLPVGLLMEVQKALSDGKEAAPATTGPVRSPIAEKTPRAQPYESTAAGEDTRQFVSVGTHKEEVIEWRPEDNKVPHLQILERTVETYGGTPDEDARRITWQFLEMMPREMPRPLFSASATFPLNGTERSFRGPWVTRKKDAQRACAKYALEKIDTHLPAAEREHIQRSILAGHTNPIGEANTRLQKFAGKSPGKFKWRVETIKGEVPPIFRALLSTDCLDGREFVGVAADGKEAKFNAARQLISFLDSSSQQPQEAREKSSGEVVFYEDSVGNRKC
ncbi:hypothetical protein FOZ61_002593 [Perkinsus olseni]|uniref:Uncharacterized protein n=1 Tax=Perkinsus olseni TaxID=32597 RepID=A0A7J6LSI4_PEROL|nr:hypothetical protein FOZ61_002593 [Perkinsus olseni]KAF4667782.1 hypothetical protein FOL46_002353 [Perkinsus olseni]